LLPQSAPGVVVTHNFVQTQEKAVFKPQYAKPSFRRLGLLRRLTRFSF
jgi:hypothetical protein